MSIPTLPRLSAAPARDTADRTRPTGRQALADLARIAGLSVVFAFNVAGVLSLVML